MDIWQFEIILFINAIVQKQLITGLFRFQLKRYSMKEKPTSQFALNVITSKW